MMKRQILIEVNEEWQREGSATNNIVYEAIKAAAWRLKSKMILSESLMWLG